MREYKEEYFRVALSTSVVVFGFDGERLLTLIGKKPHEPFLNAPTLPTNWVEPDQDVLQVAKTVLDSALNSTEYYLEQLNAFAKLYRKPEGRVVNIAHYALVEFGQTDFLPFGDYKWYPIHEVPPLVYDHGEILTFARERLKRRVKHRPLGFHFLPDEFTLNQIHALYQQVLGKDLDKRNFRKKLLNSKLVTELDKTVRVSGSKKPANLFTFNEKRYQKISLKGYDFTF